ncbi:MAG: hypothetical protein WCO57_12650 [Verrucomicrobiota bacterium]
MKTTFLLLFLCLSAATTCFTHAAPPAPAPAATTEWELWLPPSGKPVIAVFVAPRWGDGANMVGIIQKNLGEQLGIATLLTREDKMSFKEDHFVPSIAKTLTTAAAEKKHPELAHAPLLLWSHSNAAAYIQRSLKDFPERIIAYCLFKSAYGHNDDLGTGPAASTPGYGYSSPILKDGQAKIIPKATAQVFGLSIWDMNDRIKSPGYNQDNERAAMLKNMTEARKQGALVHVALVRGTHHMIDGQQDLMLSFFKTAIALRLPPNAALANGPVKLITIPEQSGFIQDEATKTIYPYASFPASGKRNEGWWLPTHAHATLWNNYALNAKGTVAAPAK